MLLIPIGTQGLTFWCKRLFRLFQNDESRECFGDQAIRGGFDVGFDDDAGPSAVNDASFGDAVFIVNGGDVVDLHFKRDGAFAFIQR